MANIYVIIAIGDESASEIKKSVDAAGFRSKYDGYAHHGVWFISAHGTAHDVSAALGLIRGDSDPDLPVGITVGVGDYYGYASKDLWEWMKVQKGA